MTGSKPKSSVGMINPPLESALEIYLEIGERPKIQVIGLGTVGQAQVHTMRRLGCSVFGYDPFIQKLPDNYITFSKSKPFDNCNITFICTMEDQVEKVVNQLETIGYQGLIVIKSSVVPRTTTTLMSKYGLHICHNPEFIKLKTAFEDAANPDRIVIGQCCSKHGRLLEKLYKPLNSRIIKVDPTTSETAKLLSNAYLALMISFWNQTHQLAQRIGINTRDLADIATADRRISRHGTKWFGKAFDGKCLPKDLIHLIETYESEDIEPTLLRATKQINDECGKSK